ncbi:MAG TPA: precorrin-6A reductase [Anaerolineae bacterium]|nr:precorrin-6A reductase [Anaerolineae bacterium]
MILILGGTTEARLLLEKLVEERISAIVSTAYAFAEKFIGKHHLIQHIAGKLNEEDLETLIREKNIDTVVDATHPFAQEISKSALQACKRLDVRYMRLERAGSGIDHYEKAYYVDSFEESAVLACSLGEALFVATGSNNAHIFAREAKRSGRKAYIRVLPDENSINKCFKAGFTNDEIIKGTGPFSYEDNYYLWKRLDVDVVVTKDSGPIGGFAEKVNAARDLEIRLVVINRPVEKGDNALESIDEVIRALRVPQKRK